jgi:hypothetical protein
LHPLRYLLIPGSVHDHPSRNLDLSIVVIEEAGNEVCFVFWGMDLGEGAVESGLLLWSLEVET